MPVSRPHVMSANTASEVGGLIIALLVKHALASWATKSTAVHLWFGSFQAGYWKDLLMLVDRVCVGEGGMESRRAAASDRLASMVRPARAAQLLLRPCDIIVDHAAACLQLPSVAVIKQASRRNPEHQRLVW